MDDGTVRWISSTKHLDSWSVPDDGSRDVFVRPSWAEGSERPRAELVVGQRVAFDAETGANASRAKRIPANLPPTTLCSWKSEEL